VLVLGVLLGFSMGWISFRSPWSDGAAPPVLYDERLVTSLFEKASRSVVEITVVQEVQGRFFGTDSRENTGSGFIVDDAGHIVTNHHVVDGAGEITVRLFDGRILPATKLGTSPADDLALLQVEPGEVADIDPLPLANSSQVRPGQMAIAIGSPFRSQNSVTVGVVSGIGRTRGSVLMRPIPDLIQTDAALNPGNSGGPLLNAAGEVVGINSSVQLVSMVQIGMGFAIPSNTLIGILPDLITPGEIKRPWIGITSSQLTRSITDSLGPPEEGGIYISTVCDGSPAQEVGLRGNSRRVPSGQGDFITAVDGVRVGSLSSLVSYLNTLRPGDDVTLTILRDGETKEIDITLAEWQTCR
jgi:2-alkenal reductase